MISVTANPAGDQKPIKQIVPIPTVGLATSGGRSLTQNGRPTFSRGNFGADGESVKATLAVSLGQ